MAVSPISAKWRVNRSVIRRGPPVLILRRCVYFGLLWAAHAFQKSGISRDELRELSGVAERTRTLNEALDAARVV